MPSNRTPSDAWSSTIPLPVDVTEKVTADSGNANEGPINPGVLAVAGNAVYLSDIFQGTRVASGFVIDKTLSWGTAPTEPLSTDALDITAARSGGARSKYIRYGASIGWQQVDTDGSILMTGLNGFQHSASGQSITAKSSSVVINDGSGNTGFLTSGGVGCAASGVTILQLTPTQLQWFSVTSTAKTAAVHNTLIAELVPKAWGFVTLAWDGGGTLTVTLQDGINVASVAVSGTSDLLITFAQSMASANYVITWESTYVAGDITGGVDARTVSKSNSAVDCRLFPTGSSSAYSLTNVAHASTTITVGFTVMGRQ